VSGVDTKKNATGNVRLIENKQFFCERCMAQKLIFKNILTVNLELKGISPF